MTKKTKQNCWEFMKCGREPNGSNADNLGVCPASTAESHNNINMELMQVGFVGKLQEHYALIQSQGLMLQA